MQHKFLGACLAIMTCLFLIGSIANAQPPQAGAATIFVTTTVDELNNDGNCSLREAIQSVNTRASVDACPAGTGNDTIVVPAGSYIIAIPGSGESNNASGSLDIKSSLTISGAGANSTIIDGGGNSIHDRVFWIVSGTVTLAEMTIQNGRPGSFGSGGGMFIEHNGTLALVNDIVRDNVSYAGGGITNGGNLSVINTTISGNRSTDFPGGGIMNGTGDTITVTNSSILSNTATGSSGGGIFNANGGIATIVDTSIMYNSAANSSGGGIENEGTLQVTRSTLAYNTAQAGGGLTNAYANAQSTLINSTVSGNVAQDAGGGIASSSPIYLNSSTIVSNTASNGDGGGVIIYNNNAHFKNTLIAENFASISHAPDCSGTLNSQGYNLIQDLTGCTVNGDTTGIITGTNPMLGPLQNNGGPTWTHALLAGSPAIDAGNPTGCMDNLANVLTTDQRGFPRVLDGDADTNAICDIGAYELFVSSHWIYLPLIER